MGVVLTARGGVVALGGLIGVVLLVITALVWRGVRAVTTPAESYVTSVPRAEGAPLPVLFRAPPFDLAESRGGRVSTASLAGTPWVGNFIFTQCTTVCPSMTARLVRLEGNVRTDNVRFVSVSVDPQHDDIPTLRAFASHWPDDARWLLARASSAELTDFARGMRVAVAPSSDPENPILHTRLLFLVDGFGDVRAVYDSDDAIAWRRIAVDLAELAGEAPLVRSKPTDASSLLARNGCNGCHDRPELAPPLDGARDRAVTLATGEVVMADDAYLRESITKPSAKLVAGYARLMPSYDGALSSDEVDALVAAVRALPPTAKATSAPAARGGPAEDPVCHMEVATTDPALSATIEGRAFHFCSQSCRETFLARHDQARLTSTTGGDAALPTPRRAR